MTKQGGFIHEFREFALRGNLMDMAIAFVTVLLDFILVSFCVFLVVKMMNRARRNFENVI
ncbi:MAG: Large-conductance mechanosensitive channel, MscL [Bacteroidota bacterium]|jgi:large-conductance mechanosensitive channel